jgi:hypothetical protein
MAAMSDESILAQIAVRFGTTEDLERDNPELMDGEFCVEVLSNGGWYAKRGKQANGKLLRWQELPYFNVDNVYGLRGEINALLAALAAEAQARQEADAQLQANINAEAKARQEADIHLQENIDAEAQARQAADTAEAQARASADEALAEAVALEAQTRQEADETEAAAREEADAQLQANIEAEAETRQAGDIHLQENIDAEAGARQRGDDLLQGNIEAEADVREEADIHLQENIEAETEARQNADEEHAALTVAHGATMYPRPNRIPLYGQDKKLHTGGAAAAYWDVVRFHEFKAALERIDDLETAADDVLVTEDGDFLTTESGVLISL